MKIVLTQNEIKAGSRLLTRVGIASHELARVLAGMKDKETITQEQMVKMFENKFDDETIANLNKNKGVISVTKNLDGVGTTIYTFIISEEFVCDANELYGDLVVDVITHIRATIKVLSSILGGRIKKFVEKWNLV